MEAGLYLRYAYHKPIGKEALLELFNCVKIVKFIY
jgi:hypothetical protein